MNQEQSPNGYDALMDLALNLRWSWNHGTDEVWHQLDPVNWKLHRNPFAIMKSLSRSAITGRMADPVFRNLVDSLIQAKRTAAAVPTWFNRQHAQGQLTCVAYFCMEFMISEALPIYSGGLGNVAGDQLKAANDLGVPVVGIGLRYRNGYFRQLIDHDGHQQATYPETNPEDTPITHVTMANGEWLRIVVDYPEGPVHLRAWVAQVGAVKLYLLDSDDPDNIPKYRGITGELYGGDPERRLQQEMALGIGGWRLLRALGLQPQVCHLNEGHAAFAVLERASAFMVASAQDFATALEVTRAGNLFTTHTAVAAGFDRFEPALIGRYLAGFARTSIQLDLHDFMALGRINPNDASECFNMAYLAIRGSGGVNGVSRLHGQISRQLFSPLFPGWPLDEVPVGYITNGVHMPTWDSADADALWTQACGRSRWLGTTEELEHEIRRIPDPSLWEMRRANRARTIAFAHEHVARDMAAGGAGQEEIERTGRLLKPDVLTLGFARRFATYKRPNLLLHDPDRLMRLLSNPQRPVQLILAGKAHPADKAGQQLIVEWTRFIRRGPPFPPVIFLSDYDMIMAESLVQGVDVWINTPRRPWEACGTSGMKVLVNGGLNFSELDGWWAEAYAPDIGWALGDVREHGDDPAWDAAEANTLYERLEREVIPEFYDRDGNGRPTAWLARIRESMARLTPRYSSNRSVREYTDNHYLPAAAVYQERAADHGAIGRALVASRQELQKAWSGLVFGHMRVTPEGGHHRIGIDILFGNIDERQVRIEIYAEAAAAGKPLRMEMTRVSDLADSQKGIYFEALVTAGRPATDFTVRVIPRLGSLSVPLEASQIRWQR
jgi:starch phosphorylase